MTYTLKTPSIFKTFIKFGLFAFGTVFLAQSLSHSEANAKPYTIRTVPENGLNVLWPVLPDKRYFKYKGLHARNVTLKSVMKLDCQHIKDHYDDNAKLVLDEIELLILVQFSLRGTDVHTLSSKDRERLAMAEVAKRLRQFGRMAETKAFIQNPSVVPSIGALCHIVDEHKEDFYRQMYHVQQKWDLHKVKK